MTKSIKDFETPRLTVDGIVFGVDDYKSATMEEKKLKLLLIRRGIPPFKGQYALPGGFLRNGETVEAAIARELQEEAGITNLTRLIPLKVYSKIGRDPRGWTATAAFIALTNTVELSYDKAGDAKDPTWLELKYDSDNDTIHIADDIIISADGFVLGSPIAFDHGQIIYDAFKKLQDEVRYHDIIFDLMPELFTVSDLHGPYRMILDKAESMQAFRKRMSSKIEETEFFDDTTMAHRKSKLYRRKKG
ncbi:MAG: NUDIX hydrolase [Ruminococcus flavefaciens]|nr:NUDIX hydrolase [Ruminococcus flavefaciens]MCM1229856.1 NUDIX hydrolase [Ruminococcus flavefaciens]